MIAKFVLVILLITGDHAQYKDFVDSFETIEACEAAKVEQLKLIPVARFADHFIVAACIKSRPLTSIDI